MPKKGIILVLTALATSLAQQGCSEDNPAPAADLAVVDARPDRGADHAAVDNGAADQRRLDAPQPDTAPDLPRPDAAPPPKKPVPAWLVTGGGANSEQCTALAVDPAGNAIVAGDFFGTITVGGTKLTSKGVCDIFVVKLNPKGKVLWATSGGGPRGDYAFGVDVDQAGNAYVAGRTLGPATFGSTSLKADPLQNMALVAKVSPKGSWVWARAPGGKGFSEAAAIATDPAGNSYLTGAYWKKVTFGSTALQTTTGLLPDLFVAKLNPAGAYQWATSGQGTYQTIGRGIAVDAAGNSYVTGEFRNTMQISGNKFVSAGAQDAFFLKLGPTGKVAWARAVGGSGTDLGRAVAVTGGGAYFTGSFSASVKFGSKSISSTGSADLFVTRVSPQGSFQWVVGGGTNGNDSGNAIAADPSGLLYVAGVRAHSSGSYFGRGVFGPGHVVLLKLDSSGKVRWGLAGGGKSSDTGLAVAVGASGAIYGGGRFWGGATFGAKSVTSQGQLDYFVWKLNQL